MDSDIPNWLFLSNHLEYRETFVAIFLALDFISLTSLFSLLIFYRLRFAFSFPLVFSECLGWTSLCFYGITLFLKTLISNKYWCQEWWACGHRGFFALSFCCLWTLSLMRVFRVVTQSHMPRVLWVRNKANPPSAAQSPFNQAFLLQRSLWLPSFPYLVLVPHL